MSAIAPGATANQAADSTALAKRRVAVFKLMGVAVASVVVSTLICLLPLRQWLPPNWHPLILVLVLAVLPVVAAGVQWWPTLTAGPTLNRPRRAIAATLLAVIVATCGGACLTPVLDAAEWAGRLLIMGAWCFVLSIGLLLGPVAPPGSQLVHVGGGMTGLLGLTYAGYWLYGDPALMTAWVFVPVGLGLLFINRTFVGVGFLLLGTVPAMGAITSLGQAADPTLIVMALGPSLIGAGLVLVNPRWAALSWALAGIGAEVVGVALLAWALELYQDSKPDHYHYYFVPVGAAGLAFATGPFWLPLLLARLRATSNTPLVDPRTPGISRLSE